MSRSMKLFVAGCVASTALVGGVTTSAMAATAFNCVGTTRSPDGHQATTLCKSGPNKAYGLRAQACSAGGCRTISSGPTAYGKQTYLNAGSAYIDQNSLSYLSYG